MPRKQNLPGTRTLDSSKIKQLYSKLKNVRAVAEEIGASYMGVRRNLIVQGVKLVNARQVGAVQARSATPSRAGSRLSREDIEAVAKGVAGAIMGSSTVQIQPKTREELWENIHEGVESGFRQIGFRH